MSYRSVSCAGSVLLLALVTQAATPRPEKSPGRTAVENLGSEPLRRGVAWLVRAQLQSGGWGQGEEAQTMGQSANPSLRDLANVADTSIAALALIRAGNSPRSGEHRAAVAKAVEFVASEIERSDRNSLYVTSARGTRVQAKLGTYIDTFLAATLLAEVKGKMPDETANRRVTRALDGVMEKIERNQLANGTWDNQGWAPVLAQSMAAKAINRAAQAGATVDEKVRTKAEVYARDQFDKRTGGFKADGSAGVALYSSAGNLGAMQDSDDTNRVKERELRGRLERASNEEERRKVRGEIDRIAGNRRDLNAARSAVVGRLADARFVQGFGSNGGEEYLSYMNIGESLAAGGGEEWQRWNRSINDNLERVQNQDGSWTGHHCITGRTFCTSAALLVLTLGGDNAPIASRLPRR